jgi:hypothetical protein
MLEVCRGQVHQYQITKACSNYKLHLVGEKEVGWNGSCKNHQGDIQFSMENGMIAMNGKGFLCIRESHQQLGGQSLLVS